MGIVRPKLLHFSVTNLIFLFGTFLVAIFLALISFFIGIPLLLCSVFHFLVFLLFLFFFLLLLIVVLIFFLFIIACFLSRLLFRFGCFWFFNFFLLFVLIIFVLGTRRIQGSFFHFIFVVVIISTLFHLFQQIIKFTRLDGCGQILGLVIPLAFGNVLPVRIRHGRNGFECHLFLFDSNLLLGLLGLFLILLGHFLKYNINDREIECTFSCVQ
mmetsp:Transcript_34726/g.84200  ORF Transcript_34726/g.84200 Transcript_34726/m.84200 type:complete len:213 (-) Transcript_34726:78-716(-)